MGLREQLETKEDCIVIERFGKYEFWPCIIKYGYPPLSKHDVGIILKEMIRAYNETTENDISLHKEYLIRELEKELGGYYYRGDGRSTPREPKHGWVYILNFNDGKTKIGLTKNPTKRKKGILSGTRYSEDDISDFITYHTKDMEMLESLIHDEFGSEHLNKEWFELNEDHIIKCKECNFRQDILDLIVEAKIR